MLLPKRQGSFAGILPLSDPKPFPKLVFMNPSEQKTRSRLENKQLKWGIWLMLTLATATIFLILMGVFN